MAQEISVTTKARVPDHVVFRTFAAETVVLNLQTGRYHGLNTSAGRMLELIGELSVLGAVADRLAAEYGRPVEDLQRDLIAFCSDLDSRELIELDREPDGA